MGIIISIDTGHRDGEGILSLFGESGYVSLTLLSLSVGAEINIECDKEWYL